MLSQKQKAALSAQLSDIGKKHARAMYVHYPKESPHLSVKILKGGVFDVAPHPSKHGENYELHAGEWWFCNGCRIDAISGDLPEDEQVANFLGAFVDEKIPEWIERIEQDVGFFF
jgi:hypothetical protein